MQVVRQRNKTTGQANANRGAVRAHSHGASSARGASAARVLRAPVSERIYIILYDINYGIHLVQRVPVSDKHGYAFTLRRDEDLGSGYLIVVACNDIFSSVFHMRRSVRS